MILICFTVVVARLLHFHPLCFYLNRSGFLEFHTVQTFAMFFYHSISNRKQHMFVDVSNKLTDRVLCYVPPDCFEELKIVM